IGCGGMPHQQTFTEQECREGIRVFNRAGEALARHNLTLCYHTHGFEFVPHGDGTLFDLFMRETKPKFLSCEMDIFWVAFAGQDPVQLLNRYPGRWKLMHLKDLQKGINGRLTPNIDARTSVALGTGQLDLPAILRAAKRQGTKYYFIEDESP